MRVVGDFEISKNMINIRKREANEDMKSLKAKLREFKKSRTKLRKEELDTNSVDIKIRKLERSISEIEDELQYYSAKFQPVLLFGIVINYKFLQEILRKTKMLHNVQIQKGCDNTVEIAWDNKGTKGKYTLFNLQEKFKDIIYIPELIVESEEAV